LGLSFLEECVTKNYAMKMADGSLFLHGQRLLRMEMIMCMPFWRCLKWNPWEWPRTLITLAKRT